eukprot:8304923-Pyramimonas_sp.AAC.2
MSSPSRRSWSLLAGAFISSMNISVRKFSYTGCMVGVRTAYVVSGSTWVTVSRCSPSSSKNVAPRYVSGSFSLYAWSNSCGAMAERWNLVPAAEGVSEASDPSAWEITGEAGDTWGTSSPSGSSASARCALL